MRGSGTSCGKRRGLWGIKDSRSGKHVAQATMTWSQVGAWEGGVGGRMPPLQRTLGSLSQAPNARFWDAEAVNPVKVHILSDDNVFNRKLWIDLNES